MNDEFRIGFSQDLAKLSPLRGIAEPWQAIVHSFKQTKNNTI